VPVDKRSAVMVIPTALRGVRVPEEAVVTEVEGLFADVTPLDLGRTQQLVGAALEAQPTLSIRARRNHSLSASRRRREGRSDSVDATTSSRRSTASVGSTSSNQRT
jgi:hypothetical protein